MKNYYNSANDINLPLIIFTRHYNYKSIQVLILLFCKYAAGDGVVESAYFYVLFVSMASSVLYSCRKAIGIKASVGDTSAQKNERKIIIIKTKKEKIMMVKRINNKFPLLFLLFLFVFPFSSIFHRLLAGFSFFNIYIFGAAA